MPKIPKTRLKIMNFSIFKGHFLGIYSMNLIFNLPVWISKRLDKNKKIPLCFFFNFHNDFKLKNLNLELQKLSKNQQQIRNSYFENYFQNHYEHFQIFDDELWILRRGEVIYSHPIIFCMEDFWIAWNPQSLAENAEMELLNIDLQKIGL